MIIISTIIFLYHSVVELRNETFEVISIIRFLIHVLLGYHAGIHECWFIYTLSIMKITYQYCPKKSFFYAIGVVCLFCAYVYNQIDLSHYLSFYKASNSIVNVCTAYPFFATGVFLRNYKELLNKKHNYMILSFTLVCSIVFMYLSANYNGYVWMYICGYGGNMLWFLIGGIAGSTCIFVFSKMLGRTPTFVKQISKGTILILGFHIYIIPLFRSFYQNPIWDFLSAFIIVLLFIPIIVFAEKHFPLILGKYRLNK